METELDLGTSMEEAFADIQQRGGGGDGASPSVGGSTEEVASPPAATPQSAAEPWRTLPKSWKKDYEAHWGKLPPEIMQYVHEREKQAFEGVSKYKSALDRWEKTMAQFKPWFDHYKIDPYDAFQRLATSHIILKYGKPEDRARWAQQLIQDYGLHEVLGTQSASGQVVPEKVVQLEQQLQALQQELYQRTLQENMATVEKFFSDPANEFAAELQDDILKLFEKGAASTLQEAYEKAMWLNPAVRNKLLQREVEKAAKPPVKGPPNVKSSSAPPASTAAGDESIEDTLKATLERIKSK